MMNLMIQTLILKTHFTFLLPSLMPPLPLTKPQSTSTFRNYSSHYDIPTSCSPPHTSSQFDIQHPISPQFPLPSSPPPVIIELDTISVLNQKLITVPSYHLPNYTLLEFSFHSPGSFKLFTAYCSVALSSWLLPNNTSQLVLQIVLTILSKLLTPLLVSPFRTPTYWIPPTNLPLFHLLNNPTLSHLNLKPHLPFLPLQNTLTLLVSWSSQHQIPLQHLLHLILQLLLHHHIHH